MAEPKAKRAETVTEESSASDAILADVTKQIAEMLAEARKEADKIIAEASTFDKLDELRAAYNKIIANKDTNKYFIISSALLKSPD